MMTIDIEVNEETLRKLVINHLRDKLGDIDLDEKDVKIEVMTKQNYHVHEWENGRFRAKISKSIIGE